MKVHLRPHHFLCLKGYQGYSYSKTHTQYMDTVSKLLKENPQTDVLISTGKDDLCSKCPSEINKERSYCHEKIVSELDKKVMALLGLSAGKMYKFNEISSKLNDIMNKDIHKNLCSMCAWWQKGLCRESFNK